MCTVALLPYNYVFRIIYGSIKKENLYFDICMEVLSTSVFVCVICLHDQTQANEVKVASILKFSLKCIHYI